MKRIIQITAVLLLFAAIAEAQQLPIYSQYNYNQFIYNPALTGVRNNIPIATFVHRNQWVGIDGAPQTTLLSYNAAENSKKIGWGGYMFHDQAGIMKRTGGYGSYAYRVTVVDDFNISFGLAAGVVYTGFDMSNVGVTNPNDPLLQADLHSRAIFDMNAGINFSYAGLDLGLAVPQLLGNATDFAKGDAETEVAYNLVRHYLGNVRYTLPLDVPAFGKFNKGVTVEPSAMVRYIDNVPLQYDANVLFNMRALGWLGAGYRSEYGVVGNIGFHISDNIAVGYAYESNVGELRKIGDTHEMSLVYKFNMENRIKDWVNKELEQVKREELELMELMEQELRARDDSIAEALKKDIVLNANNIIRNQTAVGFDPIADDLSSTASNVVGGSRGFYVVAGVYADRRNAEMMTQNLAERGFDVSYFYNKENNFYYVFLRKYMTYEDASKVRRSKINGTYHDEIWIKEVK